MTQANKPDGADRRRLFCFRERVCEASIGDFLAAAAHLGRSAWKTMNLRITTITLGAADLPRAIRFYRDGLAFPAMRVMTRPCDLYDPRCSVGALPEAPMCTVGRTGALVFRK